MKIRIKTNSSPNETVIDPGVAKVLIEEAFLGMSFRSAAGETLHVCMRDNGFELTYAPDVRSRWNVKLNDGFVDVDETLVGGQIVQH